MKTNKSSFFLIAMGIIGFFLGVVYACTLILIPVAIYCFLGAKFYMDCSALTDSQLSARKQGLIGYSIFFSIIGFPIGLISIFPVCFTSSNNVTITDIKEDVKTDIKVETVTETQEKEPSKNETSKEETIEKLEHLYSEGLITKEELERAKSDLDKPEN